MLVFICIYDHTSIPENKARKPESTYKQMRLCLTKARAKVFSRFLCKPLNINKQRLLSIDGSLHFYLQSTFALTLSEAKQSESRSIFLALSR